MVVMKNSESYQRLIIGNADFRNRVYPSKTKLFSRLATGQSPHVTMLTCSDSRIDPNLITQTEPGDLFVIRNAGNIVSSNTAAANAEVATLEFAVRGLGTEHIIVCGHSDCGAMKGLLNPEKCAHLTHVSSWVQEAQPALASLEDDNLTAEQRLDRVIEANVALQLENLRRLDFIREGEEAGTLQLHGWVFDIGSGKVVEVTETPKATQTANAA